MLLLSSPTVLKRRGAGGEGLCNKSNIRYIFCNTDMIVFCPLAEFLPNYLRYVSAVLYFIIYINLILISQNLQYFCSLVLSFQSYHSSHPFKDISFFLLAFTDPGHLILWLQSFANHREKFSNLYSTHFSPMFPFCTP